jgi:hypothetical protein
MIEPLNTEWNRKTGIMPGKGQIELIGFKHGIAYFTWTDLAGALLFLQCDEGVFNKHFNLAGKSIAELEKGPQEKLVTMQQKKTKFLKFPFDVLIKIG